MDNSQGRQRRNKRLIPIFATLVFLLLGYAGVRFYDFLYQPNVPNALGHDLIRIPTGSDLDDVIGQLSTGGYIVKESTFRIMAEKLVNRQARSKSVRVNRWPSPTCF